MRQKIDCLSVRVCTVLIFMFLSGTLFAQKSVTGVVSASKDKSPVGFATISVRGTNVSAVAAANGSFTINVPKGHNLIVVSAVGYDDAEVNVSSSSVVEVTLKEKTSSLDEIVVTGYTVQKKKSLTGAVSIVNVKDLKAVPAGSPEQMLQGRAAGVNVITSGEPGGSSNIRVRGITNFGNVDPLVIVDGVPGSMRDLDANDIESLQVLKDAGAAAIYGVRGSNGVIVITTKKGHSGKTTLTYDGYYGTQQVASGNVFNLLNTQEMADATWLSLKNTMTRNGLSGNPSHPQYGNGATPVIPDYILIGQNSGVVGEPSQSDLANYNIDPSKGAIYQITKANKQGTDWFHEIFHNAPIQSHTVSASASSDKSAYYFSMGYFDQQGTLTNTYLKRYSARINTVFNVKNNIRIGENLYMFYKDNPRTPAGNLSEGNPISMAYREQPIIPVHDIYGGYAGTRATGLGNAQNPVANVERTADNKGRDWALQGNAFVEIDFLKHFTARSSFGGTLDNYYYWNFGYQSYENAENNNTNSFNEGAGFNRSWTWTNTVNYRNTFGKHTINALAGIEAIDRYGRGVSGGSLGFFSLNPNYWILNNGSNGFTNSSFAYQNSLYSQFGKVDYAFADKYLFGATVRRDGSSVFGSDNRWGVFPSFSAGWVVTQENFMKNISWLNNLKIRGSWGKMGNYSNTDPLNAFNLYGGTADGFSSGSYYDINGTSTSSMQGFTATRYGNNKTGWEEDLITNVGLDAVLFKNKVDVSVEWYEKKINGLLFPDAAGATAGGGSLPVINIGDIQNSGVDLSATYHGNVGRDFKFDVGGIFTTYKSKIVNIPGGYFEDGSSRIGNFVRNQTGQAISAFYGYQVVGIFQSADDVAKSPTQDAAAYGRFKYKDVNGDGKITPDDRTFFGNPNPNFTYGINLGANYKGFDFSMFLYGSQGNQVINYVRYWTDFYPSFQGVKSKDLLYNSWTPERPNAKTPIAENEATFSTNQVPNSYYLEDGSYLRCKSMIIGYTFPSATLKRMKIERLRLYFQAANLFTITSYTGLDPELSGSSSAFGIDYGNYPNNQKMFNFGANLTF